MSLESAAAGTLATRSAFVKPSRLCTERELQELCRQKSIVDLERLVALGTFSLRSTLLFKRREGVLETAVACITKLILSLFGSPEPILFNSDFR